MAFVVVPPPPLPPSPPPPHRRRQLLLLFVVLLFWQSSTSPSLPSLSLSPLLIGAKVEQTIDACARARRLVCHATSAAQLERERERVSRGMAWRGE